MNLTPEQVAAVEARNRRICVDAGAGSGKTRVLVQRILHLIEHDNVELDQIAAITFTDKAAAEMKSRLRRAFREKADPDNREQFKKWRHRERQVDSARICTIHAFCSGLLRENALSLGIDPDFSVLTDAEADLMRTEAITSTLHDLLEANDADAMLLAVEFDTKRLSGLLDDLLCKSGLAERALLNGNLDTPEAVSAAWEATWPDIESALLRSFCRSRTVLREIRVLERASGACTSADDKREVLRLTLLSHLHQLQKETKPNRIRAILDDIGLLDARGGKKTNWSDEQTFESVKDSLTAVKEGKKKLAFPEVDPEIERRAARLTAALAKTYRAVSDKLRSSKKERSALDFDDLISETARILQTNAKDESSICARTARSLRHVLIDEFQDTDGVQYAIADSLASAPQGPDLFYVGDAKQSIYYFRGAEVDVFTKARSEANEALPLLGNWRTAPPVLTFVNDFFQQSLLLNAVEPTYRALAPNRAATHAESIEFLIPPSLEERVPLEAYRKDEATLIAARILGLCNGEAQVFDDRTQSLRPAVFGDAAILLRSLSNVHLYERALRQAGVPYTLVAGKGFYKRQEVLDLRNLLRTIVDPWDELALIGLLRGPLVGLTDDAIVQLAGGIGAPIGIVPGFASDLSLQDATQQQRLARGRRLVQFLRDHAERPLQEFLHLVLETTGHEGIVLRQFMGLQRASNIRKVCALASGYSRSEAPRLRGFLRYLDDLAARQIREGEAAAHSDDSKTVTIMTIHKAKGLEFPIVFLADLAQGGGRSDSSLAALHKHGGAATKAMNDVGEFKEPRIHTGITALRADEEQAEQARILYVAMTRAKDHLFLCGAPKPKGASWMNALNDVYGVCEMADGHRFSGIGWEAVVRRHPERAAQPNAAREITMQKGFNAKSIEHAIAPLPIVKREPTRFAATVLADAPTEDVGEVPAKSIYAREWHGLSAMERGTLVHAFFERWDFRSDPQTCIESLLRTAVISEDVAAELATDLQAIAHRVADSPLGKRIATATSLQREVPFLLQADGALISGTVDLIVDDSVLIDFKTGAASQREKVAYKRQLQLYAAAFQRLTGIVAREAYLLYVDATEALTKEVDISAPACVDALAVARAAVAALRNREQAQ